MRLLKLVLLPLLCFPAIGVCRDYLAEADYCIAANSGAASVECLQGLYYQSNLEIRHLEDRLVVQSRKRQRDDDITRTHHELAASSMRDAAKRFQKFSERQCDFEIGYSGAAASGSGQVFFYCLLRFNEERKVYLQRTLNPPASP